MTQLENQTWTEQAALALSNEVDWQHPSLSGQACLTLHQQGRHAEAAVAFVRFLRERKLPRIEYDAAYVAELRQAASDADRANANERFEQAFEVGLGDKRKQGSLLKLSPTTLQLTDRPELFERLAAAITAQLVAPGEDWPRMEWGTAYNILSMLPAAMFPVAECPDAALLPLLAAAARQTRHEWRMSRGWDDGMLGTASHNFWVTTFSGVSIVAMCFPELKGLAPLRDLTPTTMERCILLLFREDGFTREQSGYHFGSVQHALRWAHVAEINGIELSQKTRDRLAAAAGAHWKLLAPDGDIPHFGDGYRGVRDVPLLPDDLRNMAAWFGIGEVKYLDRLRCSDFQPPMKNMMSMLGRNLWPAYEALEPVAPPLDTALPDTQWYTMRSDWTAGGDWAAIDASPRGKTDTSHSHNALLHLVLYSRGRPVLLDNGAGAYGDNPARRWRQGSAAHNVTTVDDEDHLDQSREWRFNGQANPLVDTWITQPDHAYWAASHEGYARLGDPDRVGYCRRKLFYLRGRYWILIDRFARDWSPKPERAHHNYDLHFHLPAPVSLGEGGRAWTTSEQDAQAGNLLVVPVPGLSGEAALERCPYPLEGYDNPDHLRYRLSTDEEVVLATLLVPFQGNVPPSVAVEPVDVEIPDGAASPYEITALRIGIDGESHLYVDQHRQWTQAWLADGRRGTARVFHSRVHS